MKIFLIERPGQPGTRLIVVEKKTKPSKIVRIAQRNNDRLGRSAEKMIGSVSDGIARFRKMNKRSYKKSQEDLVADLVPNLLEGLSLPARRFGKLAAGLIRRVQA